MLASVHLRFYGENRLIPWFILMAMLLILFFMGMFLEPVSLILICAPVFFPICIFLDFDLVWFGILFVMLIQIGFITPPFGYSLFYMKSVAPPSVTMAEIFSSVWPWLIITLLGTGVVVAFPQTVLWFASMVKG